MPVSTPKFAAVSQHTHIHCQIFMKLLQTWTSELSAEIVLLSILSSVSPLSSQHHVLLLQMLIKKDCFFPSMLCTCWPHLKNFCISWASSWLIFILTVYATVCVVFAVLLLWTLSALLPQVFFFSFFFSILDTVSCKSVVICDKPHSIR